MIVRSSLFLHWVFDVNKKASIGLTHKGGLRDDIFKPF